MTDKPVRIAIRKGLDIPLAGRPQQSIDSGNTVSSVALLGPDYVGLKPGMEVREGDRVRLGQTLFIDKGNPGVHFTSPGCGTVTAIHRGARRALQSVVIRLEGDDEETYDAVSAASLARLSAEDARRTLLAAGFWAAFRTRPFSRVPRPGSSPHAIFVTAIDTNPLAADPAVVIAADPGAFADGLRVLAALTEGHVYLCTAAGAGIDCPAGEQFRHAEFAGPHPAGLPGTHMHFLAPVSEHRTAWHIAYPDVMAIGRLFTSGRYPVDTVVALGGPCVRRPRLVRTRLGANVSELLRGEIHGSGVRIVSGSVLAGHRAAGWGAYLGRYDRQVSVLTEGSPREFLSFMRPGFDKYSATRAFAAHLRRGSSFELTTTQNGSPRAMVSIGSFENVMPLDILATPLLKALLVNDTDTARDLGCLELDEEDLALCSFVCNGKYEYGPHLRRTLTDIEVNG
ncbi:MAG TPA: Na(+)-translocating NADH-quinone reductase subunit A [Woeseiaceae bacterium]|nr:Na(+)-translocating NADH-quinone reductase subunit A [Woeseiaceae bacterium]